ncbi:hypothetical protein Y032_0049g1874 [Ancylostoma ceylanicum]|nr:hypothetical protein Y032_0049g1874 [Ancylostoma ceylanicum]
MANTFPDTHATKQFSKTGFLFENFLDIAPNYIGVETLLRITQKFSYTLCNGIALSELAAAAALVGNRKHAQTTICAW